MDPRISWRSETSAKAWPALEAVARAAIEAWPARPGAWLSLAQILRQQGRAEAAAAELEGAVEHLPGDPRLRLALAEVLAVLGRLEAAVDEAGEALRLDPDSREARLLRLSLLVKRGRWQAAAPDADVVRLGDPAEPLLLDWLELRSREEPQAIPELLSRADAVLAAQPGSAPATYYKAMALARLGDAAAARTLISTETLVEIGELGPPSGYSSDQEFYAALAGEILANPTLEPDPRAKATTHGRQTRQLRPHHGPATAVLLALLPAAAETHADRIAGRAPAFAAARPAAAELRVWAVVCGADGHQKPHWHSSAWASGVCYVTVPAAAEKGGGGSLLLGTVDLAEGGEPPWGVRPIAPQPGRIVVFPSYLPHSTAPSGAEGLRISVAFDIVPVA